MSQTASRPVNILQQPECAVILRAQGINKTYRMGDQSLDILKHVDLALRAGEFLAIEGRSGSGKSTLLHIMGGLDSCDSGRLEFQGNPYVARPPGLLMATPLRGMLAMPKRFRMRACALIGVVIMLALVLAHPSRAWIYPGILTVVFLGNVLGERGERSLVAFTVAWIAGGMYWIFERLTGHGWIGPVVVTGLVVAFLLYLTIAAYLDERPLCRLRSTEFGFVFQFYHLLPELSVLENTLMAAMVENSWLGYRRQKSFLTAKARKILLELGLDERIYHKPNQLSGGERQRVAIARALMNEPKVLFADEPTGNLDYETGRQIMAVLEKLHREKGQTIVMVTHDRTLAGQADRTLVLRNGKLERPGDP